MPTGVKYDAGKAPVVQGFLHYFPRAVKAAAEVSRYGKEKYEVEYADAGWRSVPDGTNRYTDGDGRHLVDEAIDGLYDPESGLLHAAHHLWNAAARLELMLRDGVPLRKPEDGPPGIIPRNEYVHTIVEDIINQAEESGYCDCVGCQRVRVEAAFANNQVIEMRD